MNGTVYESRRLSAALSGPILWALHFLLVYVGVSLACAAGWGETALAGMPGINLLLIGFSLIVLGAMLLRARSLLRWLRRLGDEAAGDEQRGERFRGALALLLYLLSFIAVVWISLPLFVIPPCQ